MEEPLKVQLIIFYELNNRQFTKEVMLIKPGMDVMQEHLLLVEHLL